MKKYIFLILLFKILILSGQTKVAVLDFENSSNIEKYNGFGKAMSNMLLTDLKNNIHPRKISFLERSQLNKILNEQNLQKTTNFDRETAVNFGKLAGVQYVILGSIYVLDGVCNLTSRMVNVETSEIIYAKESNGQIREWLLLKSKLAEELSKELNNPIDMQISQKEEEKTEVNEGVISQYSKAIELSDEGEIDKAAELLELLKSIKPDFKYYEELEIDLEKLKEQVKTNTSDIKNLKQSGGLVYELNTIQEYINNMSSSLLDLNKKRVLMREAIKKFDIDELTQNITFGSILLMDIYSSTDNQYLQLIKDDILFLNDSSDISPKKQEYFIEIIMYEVLYKSLINKDLKENIFNDFISLTTKLYKLKGFENEISIDDFTQINSIRFFLINPAFEEKSKKIFVDYLNSLYYSVETIISRLIPNYEREIFQKRLKQMFYDKELYDESVYDIYRLLKFCQILKSTNKRFPDILNSNEKSLNLGRYIDVDLRDKGNSIKVKTYSFEKEIMNDFKLFFNEKYLLQKTLVNSPLTNIDYSIRIDVNMIGDLFKNKFLTRGE